MEKCQFCSRRATSHCAQTKQLLCPHCYVKVDGLTFSNMQAANKYFNV